MTSRIQQAAVAAAVLAAGACAGQPRPSTGGAAPTVDVQVLAFNDFHGTLEQGTGGNGRVQTTEAGGVEYMATQIAQLKAANPNTIVVSAGDNIGASTLLSGMFHDEPSIEALSAAGLQISTVGNHEFDEGWAELYRMQQGSCHPVDGCQDNTPFAGAKFQFLAANVALDPARVDPQALARSGWRPRGSGAQTLFPAYAIREVGGVKVGFIGLALQGTTEIVSPKGIAGLTFRREIDAGNEAAAALVRQGVKAIVVLIHEGGAPASDDPNTCGVRGPIVDIANGLSDDIDVVVSGHTHRAYICTMGTKLVTSALSFGRLVTDIDLTIDRRTGDVVRKTARNQIVTHDVAKAPVVTAILDHYRPFYAVVGTRPVGSITIELTRGRDESGESALGDVVADAYLEAARLVEPNVVAAFTNPGGLRADLLGQPPAQPGAPRQVIYGNVFDTLPFSNIVVIRTMTGDALVRMLEEQFDNPNPGSDKTLQVTGLTYAFTRANPAGQRIDRASIVIGGKPLVLSDRYRIASNDFIWGGGDAFEVAKEATAPVAAGVDVDTLIAYLAKHSPVRPGPQDRILKK